LAAQLRPIGAQKSAHMASTIGVPDRVRRACTGQASIKACLMHRRQRTAGMVNPREEPRCGPYSYVRSPALVSTHAHLHERNKLIGHHLGGVQNKSDPREGQCDAHGQMSALKRDAAQQAGRHLDSPSPNVCNTNFSSQPTKSPGNLSCNRP